jgi:hypothetical protein
VAQASSQWQQLVNLISELWDPEEVQQFLKPLTRLRWRKQSGPLVVFGMAVAILLWNWQLLLATGAGIVAMLAMYLMQQWDWRRILHQWRRFYKLELRGTNQAMAIAVASGGMTSLLTYLAVSMWLSTENHWMATGMILQTMGIFATLCLLVWQFLTHKSSEAELSLNQLIVNLTDADPLKRLISVRQLTSLIRKNHGQREQQDAIADYFNLMWGRETEPLVREALLEGLETLGETKQLGQGISPLSIPFSPKPGSNQIPWVMEHNESTAATPSGQRQNLD